LNDLTDEEKKLYTRQRIFNAPENFGSLSMAERHAWVKQELQAGDYQEEKNLSFRDVIYFGTNIHPKRPEHFLYRILLATFDPAEVAAYVDYCRHGYMAVTFLRSFGLERARPHLSSQMWMNVMGMWSERELPERSQVKSILESRGAEQVAPLIRGKGDGLRFLEVFGVKALSLLPHDLANTVKGRHLMNELGL
jgi:hypothetical protein